MKVFMRYKSGPLISLVNEAKGWTLQPFSQSQSFFEVSSDRVSIGSDHTELLPEPGPRSVIRLLDNACAATSHLFLQLLTVSYEY